MNRILCLVGLGLGSLLCAVRSPATEAISADLRMSTRLEACLAELSALRAQIADEKIPMARELTNLENEHLALRQDHETARRRRDHQILDQTNVQKEMRRLEQEQSYLANLFGEYIRNFETRIHISEMRMYEPVLHQAKAAHEQLDLPMNRRFIRQLSLVEAALKRIEELQGGASFSGRATSEDGLVVPGRFLLIGPMAFFSAENANLAGIAEQRLGSLEPVVAALAEPGQIKQIQTCLSEGQGLLPFDLTGGNARKMEETRETLLEHIRKGGAVMIPILIMAGLVLLLALVKALVLGFVRLPRPEQLKPLLDAVRR
ncbi:MAG: hypothetical protein U1E27_06130, partial [Kiritimatiellia bacterium]|nr:hypothetical protein [Kiritimatiellia bacterium]